MMKGYSSPQDGPVFLRVAGVGRLVSVSQLKHFLAVGSVLHHYLGRAVNKIHIVFRVETETMGIFKHPLSPGPEKVTFLIEDHQWMVGPGKGVHLVLGIHGHRTDLAPFITCWELFPPLGNLV